MTRASFVNDVRIMWRYLQHLCEAWKKNVQTQKKMKRSLRRTRTRRRRRKRRKVKQWRKRPKVTGLRSWRLSADACGFAFWRDQSIEDISPLDLFSFVSYRLTDILHLILMFLEHQDNTIPSRSLEFGSIGLLAVLVNIGFTLALFSLVYSGINELNVTHLLGCWVRNLSLSLT